MARECTIYLPCQLSSGGTHYCSKCSQKVRVSHPVRVLNCSPLGVIIGRRSQMEFFMSESWTEQKRESTERGATRGEETSTDTTITLSWIRLVLNLSPGGSQDSKTQSCRGWNTHIYIYSMSQYPFPAEIAHMKPQTEGVIATEKSDVWRKPRC